MARFKRDTKGYFYEVFELEKHLVGGRQRKFIRAKTVARLKEKIAAFHVQQEKGLAPIRKTDDHTVETWLKAWIADEKRRKQIRPSTYRRYNSVICVHIIPLIGHYLLTDLTLKRVQQMVDACSEHGRIYKDGTRGPLAPRTVRNIVTPLIEALDAAKRLDLVKENVAKDIELPKAKQPDLYQVTPDELRRFLEYVKDTRFEALFWFAVLGFRIGELLGARWADIDMDARTFRVKKAIQRVDQDEGKSKMEWIDPKSERGKRRVKFPEDWYQVLLRHKARQDEERLVNGWKENDLVFPSSIGTPMEAQNIVNRIFKPALTAIGLPAKKIRLHDFRHAAASMLIALGYDARTIADILGHSSPSFTLRQYADSFEAQRDRAVADVGELLKPGGDRILELPRRRTKEEFDNERR